MARVFQLKVLTKRDTDNLHDVRYLYGEVLRSARGRFLESGAELPTGGTDFIVPRATVVVDEYVQIQGQNFRVRGVAPLPPNFIRDRLTCTQAGSNLVEFIVPATAIAVDGMTLAVDGEILGLR